MYKITIWLFSLTTIAISTSAQHLELNVEMSDLPNDAVVYLYNMTTNKNDSTYVKNHSFYFNTPLKSGSPFILQVSKGEATLSGLGTSIYLEPGKMNISGKGGGFKRASYSGDDFAHKWQNFLPLMNEIDMKMKEMEALQIELATATQAHDEQSIQLITNFIEKINDDLLQSGRNWLDQNLNSGISAYLLDSYLGNVMSLAEKENYLKKFTGKAKDSETSKSLLKSLSGQKADKIAAQSTHFYNPNETFKSIDYSSGNPHTTAAGRPGTAYWQNQADYKISASFDTLSRKFSATANITYKNNSPDILNEVWVDLTGQNRYKKNPNANPVLSGRFDVKEHTDGFVIKGLTLNHKTTNRFNIYNDHIKLLIPGGLKPGQKVDFSVDYEFTLPVQGSDMMGIYATKYGSIYQLTSWFPRVPVYDNLKGWAQGGMGYYVEPGKLDYTIEVDAGLIVQGTGKLANPKAVLTKIEHERLKQAELSDTTVRIRTADEVILASKSKRTGKKKWHFTAVNSGDAMLSISRAFIWDAIRVDTKGKPPVTAMSLYPVEADVEEWQRSAYDMKEIIETYAKKWTAYPYPVAVLIGGGITGLAGPGVSFVNYKSKKGPNGVWSITNHELGHTWFNIMIASSASQVWACEGFCSFICDINAKALNNTAAFNMKEVANRFSTQRPREAVSTPAHLMKSSYFAYLGYMKPALALHLLRTKVLGEEQFDSVFKDYISTWSFKHPGPHDFFRFMENNTATDLSWFWQSWFLNDWVLDQAISSVTYVQDNPESGIHIKVHNKGKMVMPLTVEVTEVNGKVIRFDIPAQVWKQGPFQTFHHPSKARIKSVKIDPDYDYPDTDRSNNFFFLETTIADFPKPKGFGK